MGHFNLTTQQQIYRATSRINTATFQIEQITIHELREPTIPECLELIRQEVARIGRLNIAREAEIYGNVIVLPQASSTSSMAVPSPSGEVVGHPTTASPTSLERI